MKNYLSAINIAVWSIFIFFISTDYLYEKLTHMTTANIFPALALHLGIGTPYDNFWDIYPPGIYFFYYFVDFLTEDLIINYIYLHLAILYFTILLSYKIFEVLKAPRFLFYIGLLVFISPAYINFLLPNDLIAYMFSNLGLFLYLYTKNNFSKYFLSNFFLVFAILIKETLLLSSASLLIFLIFKKYKPHIFFSILGGCSAVLVVLLFSILNGFLSSTLEVYFVKYELFNINKTLYYTLVFSAVVIFSIKFLFNYFKDKLKLMIFKFFNTKEIIVLIHSFLILFSLFLDSKESNGHYGIPKIFPILFIFTLFFQKFKLNKQRVLSLFILIYFIFDISNIFKSYTEINLNSKAQEHNYLNLDSQTIQELKNSPSEILYLYGWGSTSFYYELKIIPYSRFWIVHPNIMLKAQKDELVNNLNKKLPKYIYYCGLNKNCFVDFDYEKFEIETYNFFKLVKNCYDEIDFNLYKKNENLCVKN